MEKKKKKMIAKVQVTSAMHQWWESDLSVIFTNPEKITIISAVVYEGGLYLIYSYED